MTSKPLPTPKARIPRDPATDAQVHRSLSLAAKNLAASLQLKEQEIRHRDLLPNAFAYPIYENKTPCISPQSDEYLSYSKDIFVRSRGNDVRLIWTQIMQLGSREERIALRDTNKLCHDIYEEMEFREMTLKKVVFNARSSSEILTLDWRARRMTQPPRPTANKIMSTSRMPPRFKAAPILRPTKWFERDKIVLNQVYFETIVFEEFRRPSYIDTLDWTSKASFHVGVEVPSGHVLLESSLTSEPLYVAPGHEHASVLVERWTAYENREWIEEGELDEEEEASESEEVFSTASTEGEEVEESEGEEQSRPASSQSEHDRFETNMNEDGSLESDATSLESSCPVSEKINATAPLPPSSVAPPASTETAVNPYPPTVNKGKRREGEKTRRRTAIAPVELVTGFSVEAISQIVAGRYKGVLGEQHPLLGPASDHVVYDSSWNRGLARTSKAWKKKGPLYLFLVDRPGGWMPMDACDPIVLNQMSEIMQTFTLQHLESLSLYLNLPSLPPPAKCRNPSVSPGDFLWKTFLQTNPDETAALPKNLKDAIVGMVIEAWRRTLLNEPVSRESPFCTRCSSLICEKAADLKPSLKILKKEAAKLRRATSILRTYKSTSVGCPCTVCRRSYMRTNI